MTREEAEERAKSMPRIRALVDFRNNVADTEWVGLDVLLPTGKASIINQKAINVARTALLAELDRQIQSETT